MQLVFKPHRLAIAAALLVAAVMGAGVFVGGDYRQKGIRTKGDVFVGDEGWAKPHDKRLAGTYSWGASGCEAGTSETFHIGPMTLNNRNNRRMRLDTPGGFISYGTMHYYVRDYQGSASKAGRWQQYIAGLTIMTNRLPANTLLCPCTGF